MSKGLDMAETGNRALACGLMMQQPRRAGLVTALVAASVLLAACSEREIILPGKREPITAVLSGSDTETDAETEVVEAADAPRDIQLPGQVANADAGQGLGIQAFRTDNPQLSTALNPVWAVNIGEGDSRKHRIVADPVVSGGRIFTLDATTQVTAVSAGGGIIWQRDVLPDGADEDDATGGGMAAEGDVLYVTTGFGAISALDAATGATIWTQDLESTGSGRPAVFGDLVYVVSGDDTGWALDKADGRIKWQTTAAESGSNVLGAPAPIVTDDLAVFAFGSGELQAVFRRGGLRRWDASVLGERKGRALSKIGDVTGQPIAADGMIYAGNQSGRTIAIDASSGARVWTANEGAIDTVLPVGGSVFLVSDRNVLLRLDGADGSRIWGTELPNFVRDRPGRTAEVFAHHGPILAGDRLIVVSSDGLLRSFDPVSGALTGTADIPGGASTEAVVAGQTLYVVSRNGQLLAYR
ncbi:PQQ-like beta-propeller repeat protein [uncultured Tateyamaria sp.]|uniref:PQQ-like beta-propeller repeat protein n=1 Tax=Tateyamaria sp. TaxID=1929288 RepID=UPI002604EA20|nr:PQQ-like beta-propeller repeat protein [uncultured Tateyamaria sp.]